MKRLTDEQLRLILAACDDAGWAQSVTSELLALRARVAKLEAALKGAREALRLPEWPSKITRNDAIVEIDDALKDAPQ